MSTEPLLERALQKGKLIIGIAVGLFAIAVFIFTR
jgi:cobalt-zinc-cadmium resistance protein CzcA